ncbi:GNAT family N-acetyltransferase [Streptomyces sp. NPDC091279]|uniref:GNAT family N-acetyltransferase n=1 Tax=unclassified Streptomyces TaxID=2593676 RepID=UPI00382496E7
MTARRTDRGGRARGGPVSIRRATAKDAKRLTRLVQRSSAYEGEYAPMIAGYRVGPDYIETHQVFVAVEDADPGADTSDTSGSAGGRLLGFYALVLVPPELDLMFVADDAQGRGIGRQLVAHLKEQARAAGLASVRVVSHPPSEGFYLSVGARRTGTVAANPPAVLWDRPELVIPLT